MEPNVKWMSRKDRLSLAENIERDMVPSFRLSQAISPGRIKSLKPPIHANLACFLKSKSKSKAETVHSFFSVRYEDVFWSERWVGGGKRSFVVNGSSVSFRYAPMIVEALRGVDKIPSSGGFFACTPFLSDMNTEKAFERALRSFYDHQTALAHQVAEALKSKYDVISVVPKSSKYTFDDYEDEDEFGVDDGGFVLDERYVEGRQIHLAAEEYKPTISRVSLLELVSKAVGGRSVIIAAVPAGDMFPVVLHADIDMEPENYSEEAQRVAMDVFERACSKRNFTCSPALVRELNHHAVRSALGMFVMQTGFDVFNIFGGGLDFIAIPPVR